MATYKDFIKIYKPTISQLSYSHVCCLKPLHNLTGPGVRITLHFACFLQLYERFLKLILRACP